MVRILAILLVAASCLGQSFTFHDQAFLSQFLLAPSVVDTNDPMVSAWASQVVSSGGAAPSAATKGFLTDFMHSIQTNGAVTNILVLNPFVPDSLTAAMTPLIRNVGPALWTNFNFVSGDLTANGLQGDGATKYIVSGFLPNVWTNYEAGISVYVPGTLANNDGAAFGDTYIHGGSPLMQLLPRLSGTLYCDFPIDGSAAGRISGANTTGGFFSINRASASSLAIYRASNLAGGFTTFGTSSHTLSGNFFQNYTDQATQSMHVQGYNDTGTNVQWSGNLMSFCAMHRPMAINQVSNFFYSVQTLRTNLGGGYQ